MKLPSAKLPITAVIAGALLGFVASRYLFVGSWLSLIPWTIVGLILGYFAASYRSAFKVGALYGFVLLSVFILAGFDGDLSEARMVFFVLLAIVGAVYGSIVAGGGRLCGSLGKVKA